MSRTLEPRPARFHKLKRAFIAFLPALAYMGLITWLSSLPIVLPMPSIPMRDKGVHLIEYGLLALLNAHAMRGSFPAMKPRNAWLAAALLTTAFGYLDELHQAFVPGRDANVFDLLADMLGAILGVSVYAGIERLRRARARATAAAPTRSA